MSKMLQIDGSILEGGGQLLRNTVAYSIILNKPIRCYQIRGRRSSPGLKRQHLAGIKLAAEISGSTLVGDELDSTELVLKPNETTVTDSTFLCDIGSAGACTLVFQSIFPILLCKKRDLLVTVKGGTNVPLSPHIDYAQHVLWPVLRKFYSLPASFPVLKLERRGFQPKGGGKIELESKKVDGCLGPIVLKERGKVTKVKLFMSGGLSDQFKRPETIMSHVGNALRGKGYKLDDNVDIDCFPAKNGAVTLIAETNTGCILGHSALTGKKTTIERLTDACVGGLMKCIESGACVDEYLQDQLIIFMALGKGVSEIVTTFPLTMHTTTALHFAQVMTDANFTVEPVVDNANLCTIRCNGIGMI